jgi:ComF family protein
MPFSRLVSTAEGLGRLLPSQCAICRTWQAQRVCAACLDRHGQATARCASCAIEVPPGQARCGRCIAQAPPFDHAVAAWPHAYPWKGLVEQLKFHDGLDLAAPLATHLARAVAQARQPRVDLVVPVPLSPARLRERGYNQAWELAWRTARQAGVLARSDLVQRQRETATQVGLDLAARLRNLQGAFALTDPACALVRHRCVAVVDDVMTTGATAGAVAEALKRGGARSVHVWVLTRTPVD